MVVPEAHPGTLPVDDGGRLIDFVSADLKIARRRVSVGLTRITLFLHLYRYLGQRYVSRRVIGATARCPVPECGRTVRFRLDKKRLGVVTETWYGCARHRLPVGA